MDSKAGSCSRRRPQTEMQVPAVGRNRVYGQVIGGILFTKKEIIHLVLPVASSIMVRDLTPMSSKPFSGFLAF